jgi:hypothetical protein
MVIATSDVVFQRTEAPSAFLHGSRRVGRKITMEWIRPTYCGRGARNDMGSRGLLFAKSRHSDAYHRDFGGPAPMNSPANKLVPPEEFLNGPERGRRILGSLHRAVELLQRPASGYSPESRRSINSLFGTGPSGTNTEDTYIASYQGSQLASASRGNDL